MSWLFGEPPTRGSRFVALFDDGSGAELFVWGDDGHLLDADGDDHGVMDREELDDWLYETGHWCWTALPEGYAVGFGVTTTSARDTRWRFAEMPARGVRFVALRKDGRGADVFFSHAVGRGDGWRWRGAPARVGDRCRAGVVVRGCGVCLLAAPAGRDAVVF